MDYTAVDVGNVLVVKQGTHITLKRCLTLRL